jgi:hypothetical protein
LVRTGSQRQSATRDLAVGRLDDLSGFPDCLVPDIEVRVGSTPDVLMSRGIVRGIIGPPASTTGQAAEER